jgi:hypothetical protein
MNNLTKLQKLQAFHDASKDHSYLERQTRNCRACREIWRRMKKGSDKA